MKIISNKRYKELVEIEEKYRILIGETFTIVTGGRSTRQKLLMLDKDELVHYIYKLNNYAKKLEKEIGTNK